MSDSTPNISPDPSLGTNSLKTLGLDPTHGSGSCEHEVSSNESDPEIPNVNLKQKPSGLQVPKKRSKNPPTKLPLTQEVNQTPQQQQHHHRHNVHQKDIVNDVSPEKAQKEETSRSCIEYSVADPFKDQSWGRRRKKAHICGAKLTPEDGVTSDECCSEISTTSTRVSYLVDGLHSCCMAPVPDYDFTPNLARVSKLYNISFVCIKINLNIE